MICKTPEVAKIANNDFYVRSLDAILIHFRKLKSYRNCIEESLKLFTYTLLLPANGHGTFSNPHGFENSQTRIGHD